MHKCVYLVLFFLSFSSSAFSETIVIEGVPWLKNVNTMEETFNEKVEGENQRNAKLVITKEGNNYLWFSREKSKLNHLNDGVFDYFIRENRSDYIKIGKAPAGSPHKFLYMEHVTDSFRTITYWGYADSFDV